MKFYIPIKHLSHFENSSEVYIGCNIFIKKKKHKPVKIAAVIISQIYSIRGQGCLLAN